MKIVFFGTPDYVVPVLNTLQKKFKSRIGESPIVAVITQKPKPAGRNKILTYSPVDDWAHKRGIPKFYSCFDYIKSSISADIGILASYGEIIPAAVIKHFQYGIINIHPSLLPKYRGASPIPATIIMDEKITGVSFTKLDEKLDKGFLISQFKEEIIEDDTTETLRKRLFERSTYALIELLPAYIKGKIHLKKLDHYPGTFTWRINKAHAFIPPKYLEKALEGKSLRKKLDVKFITNYAIVPTPMFLERFIRAMQPWPQAWTYIKLDTKGETKRLKLLKSHIGDNSKLVLDEVQLEGKNQTSWELFKKGYPDMKF